MNPSGEVWRLGHRPALDGVRGVAILMVLIDHLALRGVTSAGGVGVTMFFTLSGFLITSLMLEEHDAMGRVSLRAFYRRRVLRLLPALLVFLQAMLIAWRFIGPGAATPVDVLLALSYFGNWFSAAGFDLHGVAHTWSLAVEEQFYIAWPIVFVLLSRRSALRKILLWVAGLGAVGFATIRWVEWDGGHGGVWIYFATEARADALLIGCLVAAWLHRGRDRAAAPMVATLAIVAMVPLFLTTQFTRAVVLPTVAPLLAAAVVVSVVRGNYAGWLTSRWLVYVGRRSYALYLWNFPLLWIGTALMPGLRGLNTVLLLGASWGLTCLSWHYVERPFLARRHSLIEPQPGQISQGANDLPSG
jgi:peptidoglycan/LPS O-acetylase OafA/YrhL